MFFTSFFKWYISLTHGIKPTTYSCSSPTMNPMDALLSATVTLAQDILTEKSAFSRVLPALAAPKRAAKVTRQRFDEQSSEDEDSDLDLLVYARLMKRRRQQKQMNGNNYRDGGNTPMSEPEVLYPAVSLHEPEVFVNGTLGGGNLTQPRENSYPFLAYLRECPDLTFETQFKLTRGTFSVTFN